MKVCVVTDVVECLDERCGRLVRLPANCDPLGREIDPRFFHAGKRAERRFDLLNAAAAVDARHREVGLADVVADDAACEQHFLIRSVGIGHRESEFSAGRTTTHRHSVSARRRHSAGGVSLYCGFVRHRAIGMPCAVPEHGKHDDQAQHSGGEGEQEQCKHNGAPGQHHGQVVPDQRHT